jgi:hypothetical protein
MNNKILALAICCLATSLVAGGTIENADLRALTVDGDLSHQIESLAGQTSEPFWVAYTVPMIDGEHELCCGDHRNGWRVTTCNLESGNRSSFHSDDGEGASGSTELRVLLRVDDRRIDEVRSYSEGCVLNAGGRTVYRLDGVLSSDSIEYLAEQVDEKGSRKLSDRTEQAVAAIAYHRDPSADRTLARWTRPPVAEDLRGHVAFWLGVARGAEGTTVLKRMLRDDPSTEVREQVVFALSLGDDPGAVTLLIDVARNDKDAEIRSTALFWLGQKAGERAVETLKDAITDDPNAEVREAAVFGISQLPANDGVPILIDLARKNRHREVREQAMFWLGQSGDPRALELFEEILTN